jgi:peptide/nickel transport system substrate-binding protein
LPYIDTWAITAVPDREVMKMRVAAGEFTYQYRRLDHQALPLLAEFGEQNNYTVYLDTATNGSLQAIMFNQAYADDDEILKWNQTADFRRAVCMALDREQFNEAFYFGMGTMGSPMPLQGNPDAPDESYRTLWHTYDPDASNELLDSIGLDQKDSEGFRLRTDGSGERLTFELPLSDIEIYPESLEMITNMLADVGIHVVTPPMGNQLIGERQELDQIQWYKEYNWGAERIFMSQDAGRFNFPLTTGTWLGEQLAQYFITKGEEGMPPVDAEMERIFELYREGLGSTVERQTEIAREMWEIAVDQVYSCGIVGGLALWPRAFNNDLGNIPQGVCFDFHCRFPGLARAEQVYWTVPERRGE